MLLSKRNISRLWIRYRKHVQDVVLSDVPHLHDKVYYWRTTVFCKILTYLTPLSVLALLPSVYAAFSNAVPVVGFMDLCVFIMLVTITLVPNIKLEVRKVIFIIILYLLSIVLLYYLPFPGPGLLFLLTITIFTSLIFSATSAYLSAWINSVICLFFAFLIYLDIAWPITSAYSFGAWIAVSSNVIVLSFASAKCLDLLLVGLTTALRENKISEVKLAKANRLYHFISQINQTIVHVQDAETLFEKSCQIAIEFGKYKKAWLCSFDATQKKIVLLDSSGLTEEEINRITNEPYEIDGPLEYVFRTGNYFLSNDFMTEVEQVNWKPYAEKHNIGSCIVLPIKKGGSVFGAFCLYATESYYFDTDDIASLKEVTGDISFALDLFDKNARHQEAEDLLAQNEKRFRALIENSSDMIVLSSLEGKIIYGSPSVPKFFGYTLDEVLNTSAFDFIHPEDFSILSKKMETILEIPGQSFTNQHRILHKNQQWIWCEGTFTNLLHEPGIDAVVLNFRDISEKKAAELELQKNFEELESLTQEQNTILNTLPASIALLDHKGNILKVNEEWIHFGKVNGLPDSYEHLHKNYIEVSETSLGKEATDGKKMAMGLREVLQGKRDHFTMEYQCDSSDERRWYRAEVRPFKSKQLSGAVVMHSNISERKRAEAEMLLLINNTEESFVLLNRDLKIVSYNVQFEKMYKKYMGIPIHKGDSILDYALPERRTMVAAIYERVLSGHVEESELNFTKANNITHHFSLKYTPAKDEFGNIFGVFVTAADITEKRIAEEQKEFERRNKEALINSTDDLIWSISKEFKLIAANTSFIKEINKFFGVILKPGDEVLLQGIYPPDFIAYWKQLYTRALEGESFRTEIYTPPTAEGEESWAETSFSPIFYNEQIVGIACYSRNMTENKKAELELRASETRLAEAQALAKIGNWETDLKTFNVIWSEQTFQIFECDSEDFKSSHPDFLNFVHPDDRVKVDTAFMDSLDKDMVHAIEHRIITKRGAIKFVEERWQVLHDIQGVPIKAIGTCQDVTERKKSDFENKFKAELLDTIGQAVIATDLEGNITFWNKAAVEIYGWTYEEAFGKNILDLTPAIPSKEEGVSLMQKLALGEMWSGEFYMKRKTGSFFPAYVYNSPVYDEFGKQVGIIGVSNDISERKEHELERAKITNDLLQRNRDLEQFTFIISHNLRAPTANIIGFTEILQDETLTPQEQKELLFALSSSVSGLDSIIKDINAILQIKGEINEKKEILSFSKLVNDIQVNIEHMMLKHHVQIKVDFSEIDRFFSLKAYLHSIFYNLITNSIKYRQPDVAPTIEIKSKMENGKIILTFSDNGLGIDMETKSDKVFGLYKRFHSHVEGKGVGLFMVKTQVEALGGIITVASNVNKGTIFTIVFEN
ncbi:MAG: PAS domain S-box protein [Flavobacterium sp.]|nr:PAS domain S-box protein [Flavobacterium sp.]